MPELQTSANKGLVVLSECSKMNQLASKGFFQLKYAARIKTELNLHQKCNTNRSVVWRFSLVFALKCCGIATSFFLLRIYQ